MFKLTRLFGSGRKARLHGRPRRDARLRGFESLESRRVLTAYADIDISSSGWSEEFKDHGYSAGETIPYGNIDQVVVQFSEDVSVSESDLSVRGVNGSYGISGFSYDSDTNTAVWDLSSSLGADKVLVDLDGSVLGPSESDYESSFSVLPGDVDGDGAVTTTDYVWVDQVDGTEIGDANYDASRDLDGSGVIDFGDLATVIHAIGETLPEGAPSSNDAPVITLHGEEGYDDMWVFYGTVEDDDPDDDPYGWTVDFYGLLAGESATVGTDGSFQLATSLGSSVGEALAQTADDGGLESNVASYIV